MMSLHAFRFTVSLSGGGTVLEVDVVALIADVEEAGLGAVAEALGLTMLWLITAVAVALLAHVPGRPQRQQGFLASQHNSGRDSLS